MPARGSMESQLQAFHPSVLEYPATAAGYSHSHRSYDSSSYKGQAQNSCPETLHMGVGQIKLPKWTKCRFSRKFPCTFWSLLAGLARFPTSRQSSQAAYRGEAIPMSQSRLQSRNIRGAISHGGDKVESTHLTVLGNGTDDWLCLGWGSWVSTVDATGYTDQPRHGAS